MIGVVIISILFLQTDGHVIKITDTNVTNIVMNNDAIETSTHFINDNDVDSGVNESETNISSDSIKILHLLSNGLNNDQPAERLSKSFYGNSNINFPRRIGFGSRNENRRYHDTRFRGHRGHFTIGSTTERGRIAVGFPGGAVRFPGASEGSSAGVAFPNSGSSAAVAVPNSQNDARWNAVELLRNEQERHTQKNISCAITDNLVLFGGECQNLLQQVRYTQRNLFRNLIKSNRNQIVLRSNFGLIEN